MTGAHVRVNLGPALTALLDAIAESGEPTPCVGSRLWISLDDVDRLLAATLCRDHCPLIYLCQDAAIEQLPETVGVWGGQDYYPRRRTPMTTPEPFEAISLPPMSPVEDRLQMAGGFHVARMLLPYLEVQGLHELRAWLRHDYTRTTGAGFLLGDSRAALLEQTCHRLVSLGMGSLDYFEGVGDVMPGVPDDLSELEES